MGEASVTKSTRITIFVCFAAQPNANTHYTFDVLVVWTSFRNKTVRDYFHQTIKKIQLVSWAAPLAMGSVWSRDKIVHGFCLP